MAELARPSIRGVIVLTGLSFGETLKTPANGACAAVRTRAKQTARARPLATHYRPRSVTQCGGPSIMAKALLGHVGGFDPRVHAEMRRLQQRVQDLETQLLRVQAENDTLAAAVRHSDPVLDSIDVAKAEPALT